MNWSTTLLLLTAVYLAVFQQSWLPGLRSILGTPVELVPPLVAYAALSTSVWSVTLIATLGGLWLDALSATPFGISVLPLALTGLVIHGRREMLLRDDVYIQATIGFTAGAAVPVLTLLLLLAAGEDPIVGPWFLWRWLVASVIGAVATPVFFRVFERLRRALSYAPEPAVSFRPDREIDRGSDLHADH